MKHIEPTTTVSSSKSIIFLIITLCIAVCLIIIINLFLCTNQQSLVITSEQQTLSTTTSATTTLSPRGDMEQSFSLKNFLILLSNETNSRSFQSSITMNKFMRSIYRQISEETNIRKRKKRHLSLSDNTDFIVSLSNQYNHSTYYFEYNSSLENLSHIELILPVKNLTKFSTIHLISNQFNLLLQYPFHVDKHWLKINLTKYIQSFPLIFSIKLEDVSLFSSGFLTLYFRRLLPHSISRRDLSSFDDNQLITYPDDPSYCQVRPLRTSFSELNWTSWIVEPSSYEMNICSGTCHTSTNMPSYFIMQNLLNQIYPKKVSTPCCRPKRFSPTILLYYDGPNLILKRYNDMRVIECSCS